MIIVHILLARRRLRGAYGSTSLVVAETEPEERSTGGAAGRGLRGARGGCGGGAALGIGRAPAADDKRHELQLETARRRNLQRPRDNIRHKRQIKANQT